jgi:hypothetical protein
VTALPSQRAGDVVVFGAPGSWLDADGRLRISWAAEERARVAAAYWHAHHPSGVEGAPGQAEADLPPMRVICVAGRPGKRHNMADIGEQTEAEHIARLIVEHGVPAYLVVPNVDAPLKRAYATSTIDEVGILVEEADLTPVGRYSRNAPLALVMHRRHARRALDIWRKVGFGPDEIIVVAPDSVDSHQETVLRFAYRLLVLGPGRRATTSARLRAREERLHGLVGSLRPRSRPRASTGDAASAL